jgi:hypothetical protein
LAVPLIEAIVVDKLHISSSIEMSEISFPLSQQCKTITNELQNDPLVIAFQTAFTVWEKRTHGDRSDKQRLDVATVRKRLKDNVFTGFQAWSDAIHSVFRAAEDPSADNPVLSGVASYLIKVLNKKIQALEATNPRNYEHRLIALGKELEAVVRKVPASMNTGGPYETGIPDTEPFTVDRMMRLRTDLERLSAEGKSGRILAVVRETNGDFVPDEKELDLAHLGRRTLLALEGLCRADLS